MGKDEIIFTFTYDELVTCIFALERYLQTWQSLNFKDFDTFKLLIKLKKAYDEEAI